MSQGINAKINIDYKTQVSEFDKTLTSFGSHDKTTAVSPKSIMMSRDQLLLSHTPSTYLKT